MLRALLALGEANLLIDRDAPANAKDARLALMPCCLLARLSALPAVSLADLFEGRVRYDRDDVLLAHLAILTEALNDAAAVQIHTGVQRA